MAARVNRDGLERLGPGRLRAQIRALLHDHPGRTFTPGEIAAELGGRSSGAVDAALKTLVGLGQAVCVQARPRRYQTAEPATPAPSTERGPSGVAVRPNGQRYHPRALADRTDVAALQALRTARLPALLYGPPGTGKTSLVEAAFGSELVTVAGHEDTTVGDLVGDYTIDADGGYQWVTGPLVEAMTGGKVLLLDDATLISPKVLAVVYPVMDGRGQLTVSAHHGEVVTAEPGFYVIAGHNPGVQGAVLTEALASRFAVQIQVSTDYDLALGMGVHLRAVRAARNLASRQARGEVGWAPQLRELLAFAQVQRVLGEEAAVANLLGLAPPEDRDVVAAAIRLAFGRDVPPLGLGRQV